MLSVDGTYLNLLGLEVLPCRDMGYCIIQIAVCVLENLAMRSRF